MKVKNPVLYVKGLMMQANRIDEPLLDKELIDILNDKYGHMTVGAHEEGLGQLLYDLNREEFERLKQELEDREQMWGCGECGELHHDYFDAEECCTTGSSYNDPDGKGVVDYNILIERRF